MQSSARMVETLFCGVLICILISSHSSRSQTAFVRDDVFDIQGVHTLWVPSDPNNFNPVIISNSDFPLFKLHFRKRDLNLFDLNTGVYWIAVRSKVSIDGNTVRDWTTADEITISYTFPNPSGVSANHTINIQVDYVDINGDPLPTKSGNASYTVFAKPRVYKDSDNNSFIQLRNEDATAKIPVLMVEGFDPLNEKFPEEYYNLTWDLVNTDLIPNGYEVFILNFHDGGRDLRLNAEVVLKALERVHEICPNYRIALAGLSMGGPIARYALAKTEGLGGTHDVGLFLSYDSPQGEVNSVHVNPNMQDWIYTLDPNTGAVGKMQASLQSVAAKQMLIYNTYDRGRILHDEFYDDLGSRNGDGYPHQSYNVAVSNGNFIANPGYASEGRHLMTLRINDNLINQVPAVRLDCGTGSKISDITTRRFGDLFPNPFFTIVYSLEIIFNPSYEPTYSALDLVNPQFDDLTGDITSFERSRFDDYVVQATPLQHHELSTTTRTKIMYWLDKDFNITVNYDLPMGGSVNPDNYQVNILHGITITVQPKTVNVGGTQIRYVFDRWEDGNTSNPRTFYASHNVSHTAVMKPRPPLVSTSPTATATNNQRKLLNVLGTWNRPNAYYLAYQSAGDVWYTRSFNNGTTTWSGEVLVSRGTGTALSPSIAEPRYWGDDTTYVVWLDTEQSGGQTKYSVFFRKISLVTGQLTPIEKVEFGGAQYWARPNATPVAVRLGAMPNFPDVTVAFEAENNGIILAHRYYYGSNGIIWWWTQLQGTTTNSARPSMAISFDATPYNVSIAFDQDGMIYFATSSVAHQYPVVFGTPAKISSDKFSNNQSASLAVSPANDKYVSWISLDWWYTGCGFAVVRKWDPMNGWTAVSAFIDDLGNPEYLTSSICAHDFFQGATMFWADRSVLVNMVSPDGFYWTANSLSSYSTSFDFPNLVSLADPYTIASVLTKNTQPPYQDPYEVKFEVRNNSNLFNQPLAKGTELDSLTEMTRQYRLIELRDTSSDAKVAALFGEIRLTDRAGNVLGKVRHARPLRQSDVLRTAAFRIGSARAIELDFGLAGRNWSRETEFSVDLIDSTSGENIQTIISRPARGVGHPGFRGRVRKNLTTSTTNPVYLALRFEGNQHLLNQIASNIIIIGKKGMLFKQDGSEGSQDSKPVAYAIHQNFPNPFNPSTTIKFDLPENSNVSLVVYDVLGRKVSELVNGSREAGYHSATWDASNVASGVYFARFTAADANGNMKLSKVSKLLLTK